MAHRKVRSLGSVPFSWEEMPGVPKQSLQIQENKEIYFNFSQNDHFSVNDQRSMKIVTPPPGRSPSIKKKIMWGLQDPDPDPFAKAIKECTKSYRANKATGTTDAKKGILCFGSCKKSYDNVEKGNLVKLTMKQQYRYVSRDRRIAGAIKDEIGSGFKSDGSDKPLFISLLK